MKRKKCAEEKLCEEEKKRGTRKKKVAIETKDLKVSCEESQALELPAIWKLELLSTEDTQEQRTTHTSLQTQSAPLKIIFLLSWLV